MIAQGGGARRCSARGGMELAVIGVLAACASTSVEGPKAVTGWRIPNFSSVEECVHLAAADRLDYDFTSTEPVDFAIRYYDGNAVVAPVVRERVTTDSGRFQPLSDQNYCLVWETGLRGALINYRIVPRRG